MNMLVQYFFEASSEEEVEDDDDFDTALVVMVVEEGRKTKVGSQLSCRYIWLNKTYANTKIMRD